MNKKLLLIIAPSFVFSNIFCAVPNTPKKGGGRIVEKTTPSAIQTNKDTQPALTKELNGTSLQNKRLRTPEEMERTLTKHEIERSELSNIKFRPIYFGWWGLDILNKEDLIYNIKLARKAFEWHPSYTLLLIGNSSKDIGGLFFEDNMIISLKRAIYIRDIFIREGIPASKIEYKGVGYQQSTISPEKGVRAQAPERRVDIFFSV